MVRSQSFVSHDNLNMIYAKFGGFIFANKCFKKIKVILLKFLKLMTIIVKNWK